MNSDDLLTNKQPLPLSMRPRRAAAELGISLSHLERLTKAGEIPVAKLGRCTVYVTDALRAYLVSQMEGVSHATH